MRRHAGIRFLFLRNRADTSTTTGRLIRTIIAGFAEYEREIISERIRAGDARARYGQGLEASKASRGSGISVESPYPWATQLLRPRAK